MHNITKSLKIIF